MACNCGGRTASAYLVTLPDGRQGWAADLATAQAVIVKAGGGSRTHLVGAGAEELMKTTSQFTVENI